MVTLVSILRRFPHGSCLEEDEHGSVRLLTSSGRELWRVVPSPPALTLARPTGELMSVQRLDEPHPVLGPVDGIFVGGSSDPVARCGRIDWSAPERIPPIDRPGAIPSGAGSALLNLVAVMRLQTGGEPVRYRGPYPTAALFDSLRASFELSEPIDVAAARFTHDAEALAIVGRSIEIDVDFAPAPFEWSWPRPDICVQLRDGLERVYLGGVTFERDRIGPRRLRIEGDEVVARVELAGRPWTDLARFSPDGSLLEGPHSPPAVRSSLLGEALPPEIVAILAAAIASRAPTLLRSVVQAVMTEHPIRWGATGVQAARMHDEAIEVHAVLGERLPELEPVKMLEALGAALEPVVLRMAQHRLAAASPA